MIPINNIYYMLSYAFKILKENSYNNMATEKFENVGDLCAAILCKGVSLQLKRGLGKEYILKKEPISTIRGKVDISDSIKTNGFKMHQLTCSFDEFSENSQMNRIIKTTLNFLLHLDISTKRKKEIRKILLFFIQVDNVDKHSINWSFQYNSNNKTYQLLLGICKLAIKGLIQTKDEGKTKLMDFDEANKARLFEKFILEYYRQEFPKIKAFPAQIEWQLNDNFSDMLPKMKTDITLIYKEKIHIIDAKYYSQTTQKNYSIEKIHSNNLYQIFTYVKNKEFELKDTKHKVSGMLIYARTEDGLELNHTYNMSGNSISAKTLDLNCPFSSIKEQLNLIIIKYFPEIYID